MTYAVVPARCLQPIPGIKTGSILWLCTIFWDDGRAQTTTHSTKKKALDFGEAVKERHR